MKTGIVLEGGAMRGMFTAGILDVWMEQGISFDTAVGVSAGATFGINLKSHQIGRTLRYNKKYCKDKRYGGLWSLIKTGDIYNAKFDYDDIPNRLDPYDVAAHRDNSMDFWVVTTDVDTGLPVYKRLDKGDGEDITWLRASASMPGVSNVVHCTGEAYEGKVPFVEAEHAKKGRYIKLQRPVYSGDKDSSDYDIKQYEDGSSTDNADIKAEADRLLRDCGYNKMDCDGHGFLDGGMSDSVPVKFIEDLGCDKIVVICTQPYGYRKKKNGMMPILKHLLKAYPELINTMSHRHLMYNATMEYLDSCAEREPDRIRVIRPEAALNIKKVVHDPKEIQRVYDIGYAEGMKRVGEIRRFLDK